CLGRGEGLFGPDSMELRIIQERLGDFPLVGFFANGEFHMIKYMVIRGYLPCFWMRQSPESLADLQAW
ncbi:MAG: FIST C-terminal domain-containing protein, partial [Acidithiobacillus ferriphilus]